jgi:hypothetical protein
MLRETIDGWHKIGGACLDGAATLVEPSALIKYRPMWVAFLVPHILVGCVFWAKLMFNGSSAFSPETWGNWACVLPAELWAGVQIAAALMALIGLIDPPRWRLVAAGSALNALQFQALALSAILSDGQTVIGVWPCVMFTPAHILLAVEAWQYGRRK